MRLILLAFLTAMCAWAQSGAAQVTYKPTGATTNVSVQSALRSNTILPQSFGAKCDGTTDDSAAFARTTAKALPGDTIEIYSSSPCVMATSSFFVPAGVCADGITTGTVIKGTGSFPTIAILNSANACVRNLTIQSVISDPLSIANTDSSLPTEYPLISNVNIGTRGPSSASIHVTSTTCCVYWATFNNVNISNNGTTGTGQGYLFDGTPDFNVRPMIIGGRVSDAAIGLDVESANNLQLWGTEFDDIINSGSGIAIWLQNGVTNAVLRTPRLEGDGVDAPIDKDWQLDSGTNGNQIYLDLGYGGVASRGTDAGINNCVYGGNGSGGQTPYCILPQIVGNLTVASGSQLAVPGSTSDELTVGVPLTLDQTLVGALMTVNAPSTGLPLVMRADSAGRWFMGESQNFSDAANTGTAITISPSAGISCYTAGVSALTPCQLPVIQTTPGISLANITATSWGNASIVYCSDCGNVHDNAAVAGAECVGSGSGAVAKKQNGHWDCN